MTNDSLIEKIEALRTGIDAPYQEGWDHGLTEAAKIIRQHTAAQGDVDTACGNCGDSILDVDGHKCMGEPSVDEPRSSKDAESRGDEGAPTPSPAKSPFFALGQSMFDLVNGDASTRKDEGQRALAGGKHASASATHSLEETQTSASPSEISVVEHLESLKTGIDSPYQEGWDHGLSEAIKSIKAMKPVSSEVTDLLMRIARLRETIWSNGAAYAGEHIRPIIKSAKAVLDTAGVSYVE